MNIHSITAENEADDLIASYTREALNQGHRVIVVGEDKDLVQLVGM